MAGPKHPDGRFVVPFAVTEFLGYDPFKQNEQAWQKWGMLHQRYQMKKDDIIFWLNHRQSEALSPLPRIHSVSLWV